MNPTKKKEMIERVQLAYEKYRMDLLAFYADNNKSMNTRTDMNPDDYYNETASETMRIKPNIYFYLDRNERRVLKAILAKKPGYEKIKLG